MKRSGPLRRGKPLTSSVICRLDRKRQKSRKRDSRRRKRSKTREAWRQAVLDRARHLCERCGADGATRKRLGHWLQAHHRLMRSQGGKDELKNGAALCGGPGGCHDLVHSHLVPDWRDWIRSSKGC